MIGWWKDEDIRAKLGVIPALAFGRLDDGLWELLREDGPPEDSGVQGREQWRWAELPLSHADRQGLRAGAAETVERYNNLNLAIKATYGRRYVDMVDYQAGAVVIFRCDGLKGDEDAPCGFHQERH